MKAIIRINTDTNLEGNLTYIKSLGLYKIANKKHIFYVPGNSIDYVVALEQSKSKSRTRKRSTQKK